MFKNNCILANMLIVGGVANNLSLKCIGLPGDAQYRKRFFDSRGVGIRYSLELAF